jgi:hypothetical protein
MKRDWTFKDRNKKGRFNQGLEEKILIIQGRDEQDTGHLKAARKRDYQLGQDVKETVIQRQEEKETVISRTGTKK